MGDFGFTFYIYITYILTDDLEVKKEIISNKFGLSNQKK